MPTYKDANDREWTIKLDSPTILRIRSATCDVERCKHLQGRGCTGIDLGEPTGETQYQLRRDLVMLVNTLYLLCQKEPQERGISDEQFGACVVGDAIERATGRDGRSHRRFFPGWHSIGIHPEARTLRELFMMVKGRARFLGATSAAESQTETIPYNPTILQAAAGAM
ncbi:MAG TPA: hypothetical protein VHV08_09205 [Pirellulales bacterium]|nr:hypothetical protein [Pirellulales bacterium]